MVSKLEEIQTGMPLYVFAPASINLKAFEMCEGVQPAIFILDTIDEVKNYAKNIRVDELLLKTHYLKVWDLCYEDDSVGCVISLSPGIEISYMGKYCVALRRIVEPDICPVEEWEGDWVRLIEGDNGCVVFNSCELSNAATRRMDIA